MLPPRLSLRSIVTLTSSPLLQSLGCSLPTVGQTPNSLQHVQGLHFMISNLFSSPASHTCTISSILQLCRNWVSSCMYKSHPFLPLLGLCGSLYMDTLFHLSLNTTIQGPVLKCDSFHEVFDFACLEVSPFALVSLFSIFLICYILFIIYVYIFCRAEDQT